VNEEVFPLFSLASALNALRGSPVIRFVSALNGDRVGEKPGWADIRRGSQTEATATKNRKELGCIFFLNDIEFKFVLAKFIEISSGSAIMKIDWIDSVRKLASNLLQCNNLNPSERRVIEEFIYVNEWDPWV
jgi:hypothetical protein